MALNISTFLAQIQDAYSGKNEMVARNWRYPFILLEIRSPTFSGLDDDEREAAFASRIGANAAELRDLADRSFLRWDLLVPAQTVSQELPPTAPGWLALLGLHIPFAVGAPAPLNEPPKYLHFYGFKGGQGRTTALCAVAKALSEDGYKVLAIDLDSEAPSLDLLLQARATRLSSSVLGLRANLEVQPVGLGTVPGGGEIKVLPFRPDPAAFDIDAAALAFELQGHPPTAETLSDRIAELATREVADIVLIDHRTGLGPVVPVVVNKLHGPIVFCSRLDGQDRRSLAMVEALWRCSQDTRGVLLSPSIAEEDDASFRTRTRGEAEEVLDALARAINGIDADGEPLDAQELSEQWVLWPYSIEIAVRHEVLRHRFARPHIEATNKLRRVLGLSDSRTNRELKKSGATDAGDLIVTQALRALRPKNSPYSLIVGRKGTGKTRLVRALVEEGVGQALLVPNDFPSHLPGIRHSHVRVQKLIQEHRERPESFWYSLIVSGLEFGTADPERLLDKALSLRPETLLDAMQAASKVVPERIVFLVDALESAFPPDRTFDFVRGLFRVLETIDATPELNSAVQLRIFVRKDLVEHGIQNREQIESGRRVDLFWDTQTIYNFVLSRIESIAWYEEHFADVVQEIRRHSRDVHEGLLLESDCEAILLRIFPERLTYKNMSTSTFLRTYFSDESAGDTSFYPRIYMVFLEELAKRAELSAGEKPDSKVIVEAHQQAASLFLEEVIQELVHAARLDLATIKATLAQLNGERTPFDIDIMKKAIAKKGRLDYQDVSLAMETMKTLGVFEDYPKRPNQWRPGRLFKTALGMRFKSGRS